MHKLLTCLCIAVAIFAACSDTEYITEDLYYREAIDLLDWGTDSVIVIGHKTPDCDATCSAISYAGLMTAIGHPCAARTAGTINREMAYASTELGIDIPPVQDSVAPNQRIILTDHSEYAQAVTGAASAHILQVIDHHGIGDITAGGQVYYKAMPFGSTCTIVYTSYKELGVAITDPMAKAMLTGIISDTRGLNKTHTTMDSIALYALADQLKLSRADVDSLNKHMNAAASSYFGMTDREIYLSDYKDYAVNGVKFGMASLTWSDTDTIEDFLLRMRDASASVMAEKGNTMMFAIVKRQKKNSGSEDYIIEGTYLVYYGEGAKEIAETAYGPSTGEAWVFSSEALSRKADVIPRITEVITTGK